MTHYINDSLSRLFENRFAFNLEVSSLTPSIKEILVERIIQLPALDKSIGPQLKRIFEYIDLKNLTPVSMYLTQKGVLGEISKDLILPLATYFAQMDEVSLTKVFTIDKAVKVLDRGLTWKAKSSFSIVYESKDWAYSSGSTDPSIVQKAIDRQKEVIVLVSSVINHFGRFFVNDFEIEISHSHFMSLFANQIGLEQKSDFSNLWYTVNEKDQSLNKSPKLAQNKGMRSTKAKRNPSNSLEVPQTADSKDALLWKLCNNNDKFFYLISKLKALKSENYCEFETKIRKLFSSVSCDRNKTGCLRLLDSILGELKAVDDLQHKDGWPKNIRLTYSFTSPIVSTSHPMKFNSGLLFSAKTTRSVFLKKHREDLMVEIAYGGRYDNLVQTFQSKETQSSLFACGAVINNFEIFEFIKTYSKEYETFIKTELDIFKGSSVMVASYSDQLSQERFPVACQLWQAGIKAEIFERTLYPSDTYTFEHFKKSGVSFVILLKQGQYLKHATLTLKSLRTSKDIEVSLDKCIEIIKEKNEFKQGDKGSYRKDIVEMMLK